MFPAPASPAVAGIEGVAVAAVLWLFGLLLAGTLGRRLSLDPLTRCALAFPSLIAFSLVLMLGHVLTRGWLFSHPWAVRAIVAVTALVLLAVRTRERRARGVGSRSGDEPDPAQAGGRPRWERAELWALVGVVVLALLVWGSPVFRMNLVGFRGDISLHTGWANQLLNGASLPGGPLTGDIPNYYPWLFHGLIALISLFTPGGRPFVALGPLQFLIIAGWTIAFFALGKQLAGRWLTGAAASVLCVMCGGFGFVLLRHLDVVVDPRHGGAATYMGDLLYKRSYNMAFANLVPPLPRDVTFCLFAVFLLLLVLALQRGDLRFAVGGGIILGLIGLVGAEAAFVGVGAGVFLCLWPGGLPRLRLALALFVPFLALWALWVIPLFWNYVHLGGFRNMASLPVSLTPVQILGAWGVATPLACWGAIVWVPRVRTVTALRVPLVVLASAASFLIASYILPDVLGGGFLTLSRRHRYWPFVFLGVSLFAALGLCDILDRAARRARWLAGVVGGIVVLLAIASPTVASLAIFEEAEPPPLLSEALEGHPNLLNALSPEPGQPHVVAVPEYLERLVFAYTGYPMVAFQWTTPDFGHIRWADIFDHMPSPDARLQANAALTTGVAIGRVQWLELAHRYGVDEVLVPQGRIQASAFEGCEGIARAGPGYFVVHVATCAP